LRNSIRALLFWLTPCSVFSSVALGCVLLAASIGWLGAAPQPYVPDGWTLHLWHLDEATTPCIDSAPGGTNLLALAGGATLGYPSHAGFGTALNTADGGQTATGASGRNAVLSALPLADGLDDNVRTSFADPVTGAFTFEAIVLLQFDPALNLAARGSAMQILSADAEDSEESSGRLFQWRLAPVGVGSGDATVPRFEFINLRQGFGIQTLVAPIPTVGRHAIASNGWYHVAVSYNGLEGSATNFSVYWTSMKATNATANRVSALSLDDDLASGLAADLCIGNEGRATGGSTDNFIGAIDEVRVSGIGRSSSQFFWNDDSDNDGLADAWELTFFTNLTHAAEGDFDNDTYSNLEEFEGESNPAISASIPGGTDPDTLPEAGPSLPHTRYVPVDDGDSNTSEYAYAGSSAINAVSFICSALTTVSNQQFIAYYGRHQTNPAFPFNNRIWIGRRTVGSSHWEVFRTTFAANAITDGHDVVCFGIDGHGFMHMSWGMHGDAFHYARSLTNVIGSEPIAFGPDSTMTGAENAATYPQFVAVPGGDLLYLYRKGSSGAGDTYLNRYVLESRTWTNVHRSGSSAVPFIKGTGWPLDYNAYGQMPCIDEFGRLHLVWTWRYTPAFQSNHDFAYATSPDSGLNWERSDGSAYALPISESLTNGGPGSANVAERILAIAPNSSLINQAGMCLDAGGRPVIATWWSPGAATNNHRRQYMVAFPDDANVWQVRQISNRTNDPVGTVLGDSAVRDLGRPVVVCDRANRIVVLYRDNAGSNGLTIVHSLPKAMDPDRLAWTTVDLTTTNLGNYEPVIDLARWQRDNVLSVLYQPSSGLGYTPPANTASEIGVLEWDAADWFSHRPALEATLGHSGEQVSIGFRSQPGWGYRLQASNDLSAWTNETAFDGTGGFLRHVETNATASSRYWRLIVREGGLTGL